MKTSKKLLSLFLALVMIITSCSIGFTAFAADGNKTDKNNNYWSDGTDAETAFNSLNDLVDTYIPQLLQIEAIKNLLEDNLGMTVTDTTTISDVVAGASPLLLGLLGGSADKTAIRGDSSAMADIYFSYLDDEDAVMDFYALYKFCEDNKDSSNSELKAYCSETFEKLEALLKVYKNARENYDEAYSRGIDLMTTDGEKYADAINAVCDYDYSAITLEELENIDVDGTKLKDVKDSELDAFIKYTNGLYKATGSNIKITNPAEAFYYLVCDMGAMQLIVNVYLYLANLGGATVTNEMYGGSDVLTPANYTEKMGDILTLEMFCEFNEIDLESVKTAAEGGDTDAQEELAGIEAAYEANKDSMSAMLVYQILIPEDNGYGAFDSPYFSEMSLGTLLYAGVYTKEDIDGFKVTDQQLAAYGEYASTYESTHKQDNGTPEPFGVNQFTNYINSDVCAFSEPVRDYFKDVKPENLVAFINAGVDNDIAAMKAVSKDYNAACLQGKSFDEQINAMIPSELSKKVFGAYDIDGTSGIPNDPLSCYILFNEYETSVAPATEAYAYDYDDYAIPNSLVVDAVNSQLNGLLGQYLTPGNKIADLIDINEALAVFLESDVSLYNGDGSGVLDDLWLNLYNKPIETIFNLIPTLVILIDELVLPLVLHGDGDSALLDLFASLCGPEGLLAEYSQEAGSDIGIGALSFDLNKVVPAILHWLIGEEDEAYAIVGNYTGSVYDNDVPVFTNIYVADKALYGAHLNGGLAKTLKNGGMDEKTAKGLDEIVTEIATFGCAAVDEYLAGHKEDPRYGNDVDSTIVQRGLNNIFVALPQIIDIMGQNFIQKYDIDSDWAYTYDGKIKTITKSFSDGSYEQLQNATLQAFKDTATAGDADVVLNSFVDILIGNWINGLLDLLNDTLSDDSNKITSELALVQGLLDALGGLGEKSIITDLVNGLFQLKRADDASFTLEERETTHFVGFSNESGFFLLSNIQFTKNGKSQGIVPLVMELINGSDKKNGYKVSNAFAKSKSPLLASTKSAAGTDYSKLLTKKNEKAAQKLIDALDELLSSLLANTSLNGFDWDSTDNLLSSLVTFASAYFGAKNTNDIVVLLNNYLYYVTGESKASPSKKGQVGTKPTADGDVDKSKVYTSANLSNLVIQTYSLVENIIDYLFYNNNDGLLKDRDSNMLIADALYGIVSPDAVAIRLSDDYSDTAAILKDTDHLNWNSFKVQVAAANTKSSSWKKDYLKFGFGNGDKNAFYDALGESLNGVASIVSVLLTKSYTDAQKSGNYYSEIVYPVVKSIADANGVSNVMSVSAFNAANASDQLIKGILTPISGILDTIYDAPVSMLLNTVKGLAKVLQDSYVKKIVNGAINPINNLLSGVVNVVNYLSPTFASIVDDALGGGISLSLPQKNVIVSLLNGLIGDVFPLPNINWTKLATAKNPAQVLLLVYGYLVDTVLGSELIQGLIEAAVPGLVPILKKLSAVQILDILNKVLAVVQSPTEIYWTFSEYASRLYGTFSYPKNITAAEADRAVDQLDDLVANVFPLLNGLGVTDIESLSALVNDKLYTNGILTSAVKGLYGLFDNEIDKASHLTIGDVLRAAGIDTSPAGIAAYLTDKEYGKTYSSVANSLKKAKKWDKVGDLNWGFKDGSAKAETGFINGLAAIFRPFNDILAVFLAEGKLDINDLELKDFLKKLNISGKTNLGEGEYGCILKYALKNGKLTLNIRSNVKTTNNKNNITNVLEVDLIAIIDDLAKAMEGNTVLNLGTNGYESAIIPILEAFMCDGVKTYKQYKSDYAKAKDNLLINVLKPLIGFVDDVVATPFNTVTKVLPNVAYFIDSNGVAQAVGNLLAPITAKDGVLGVLDKNGLNVDKLIKAIAGKSLGKIITDALGIKVKLNFQLTHLEKCNIQDIVVPLVNKILKDKKINIVVPAIDFGKLASHGYIKTVSSKAKNRAGKYTTRRVISDQGETLIAVLRFVADTLIKNAYGIRDLLCGIDAIKKNATISGVLKCVFNTIATAYKDDIVRAVFYFLTEDATDSFFDYSNFKYDDSYEFTFGNMDEDFCRQLAPMLDGLISGLIDLNSLITEKVYTDDIISTIATGLYGAVEGVDLGEKIGSLTNVLAMTDIDFTTGNVAKLLVDEKYGKTYPASADAIKNAGSWKKVNKKDLTWGVKDRDSFLHALCAVLRPIYGVLDVLLNDASLNLFDLVKVPGSDGYTSTIAPLFEAFECYNIKTQYQYREDIYNEYDSILLDILNPLLDKVEDILAAPIEMVADILPNLSLFFANDGLLQVINNLLTPVSALLNALRPIVDINELLKAINVNVPELLAGLGIKVDMNFDIYNLPETLKPLIGADNVVNFLNQILGIIKIKGAALGLELPAIDWFQLASHGEFVTDEASQVASYGKRIYVKSDQDETLIAVLRYLINTINYKGNYDAIVDLIGGLLGDGASDSISDIVSQVLGMLQGDADEVIESLVDLLQSLA